MKRLATECRLAASPALTMIAVLFLATSAIAIWNGMSWRSQRIAAVEAERGRGVEEIETIRRELAEIEAGKLEAVNATLPTRFLGRFNHRAILPAPPLSVGSIGQADLHPFAAHVSLFSVKHSLLDKHELADPLALLAGRFDLAFVMVWLLPLVILAFTFDVISRERERGILSLALAQSGTLPRLLRAKLGARALLLGVLIAIPLFFLLLLAPPFNVALWAATLVAYALFWIALAVAVNLWGSSSATNATILTGAWLLLLVVMPAALNVHVTRKHPLPSRLDALAEIRSVNLDTAEAGERLLGQFLQEHPDLAAAQGGPGAGQYYAVRQSQERNILPLVTALEEQLAAQHTAVARYSVLSPAIITDELLLDIAGTGRLRFESYHAQLRLFLDRWREHFVGRAFRGGLVTPAELDGMPHFAFAEEPLSATAGRASRGIALLLIPTFLLVGITTWKLRGSPRM